MDKILTVVIPAYNVEKTLQKTIDSLLVPDLTQRSMLDLLIVNDGSSDGTESIARRYENENRGIVRVYSKENGGHGSTINVGIEQAMGKYIKIVDGDDWLDTVALEKYIQILLSTDADMVATDYCRYYMEDCRTETVKASTLPYNQIVNIKDIWCKFHFQMHSYAVKTYLLRKLKYRIDEHCFYVDTELNMLVAMSIQTVLYSKIILYVYRLQQKSQSVSAEGWMRHYRDHERVGMTFVKWHGEFVTDSHMAEYKKQLFERIAFEFFIFHYKIGVQFPLLSQKEFVRRLREYDACLKQDELLYLQMSRNKFIRLCRFFHFSQPVYSMLALLTKLKRRR